MANKDDSFEDPILEEGEILSAAEIAKIKAEARAEILADKRKDAKTKLLTAEKQRLRNEEGLTTGNAHSDEIVSITIDLAQFAPNILINNQAYWHGRTYQVPRHVADTLRDVMYKTWGHQAEIDGKSRSAFYAEKHIAELYKPGTRGTTISAKAA